MSLTKTIAILAAGIGLSGCSLIPGAVPGANQPVDVTTEKGAMQIAKAIESGDGVNCVITEEESGSTINYSMMGKKVRADGIEAQAGQKGTMISDGENLYTWTDETKEGFKMTLPPDEENQAALEQGEEVFEPIPDFASEEIRANMVEDGYDVKCQVGNVDEGSFVPPTDIEFTDFSSMMHKSLDAMSEGLEDLTPEQQVALEDAMKQYGQ